MKTFAILPAFALAACAATLPTPNPTGTPTAGFQQTATVGSLQVTPVALVEDSRCPINARCVWAGHLTVRAEIRGGRWKQVKDLTLSAPQPVADGQITLVDALPQKVAGKPASLADYRFTFSFSGGL
ncbi:hypothetical protein [Sphingomonas jaspsi]|uniref:hypothetical protein n=1 Tax=Sphingomonas jaspsi TaxID=392409 RepID=UPI0004AD93F8|nr:hypothetical protein [Sphingomonas jaspsi]